jgi:hypothetical protein
MDEEKYLGDGVYATVDEYGEITLDLRGQDHTTSIVMEPQVVAAFVSMRVVQRIIKDYGLN